MHYKYHYLHGVVCAKLGIVDEAKESYNIALRWFPNAFPVYLELANIAIVKKEYQKQGLGSKLLINLENEFKIVVISSWRKNLNYKELLYESGLDKQIEILGATDVLDNDREYVIPKTKSFKQDNKIYDFSKLNFNKSCL